MKLNSINVSGLHCAFKFNIICGGSNYIGGIGTFKVV